MKQHNNRLIALVRVAYAERHKQQGYIGNAYPRRRQLMFHLLRGMTPGTIDTSPPAWRTPADDDELV